MAHTNGHANGQHTGKVVQVIGSTFDAEFEEGHLPEIYNAVRIDESYKGVELHLVGEVQQHLGGNRVRAVALGSTDGLMRGMKAVDTGGRTPAEIAHQISAALPDPMRTSTA